MPPFQRESVFFDWRRSLSEVWCWGLRQGSQRFGWTQTYFGVAHLPANLCESTCSDFGDGFLTGGDRHFSSDGCYPRAIARLVKTCPADSGDRWLYFTPGTSAKILTVWANPNLLRRSLTVTVPMRKHSNCALWLAAIAISRKWEFPAAGIKGLPQQGFSTNPLR